MTQTVGENSTHLDGLEIWSFWKHTDQYGRAHPGLACIPLALLQLVVPYSRPGSDSGCSHFVEMESNMHSGSCGEGDEVEEGATLQGTPGKESSFLASAWPSSSSLAE